MFLTCRFATPAMRAAVITSIATLIAGLLAFAGILAGLWANRKSQKEERLLILRRNVYLEFADRFSTAMQLFSSLADPEMSITTFHERMVRPIRRLGGSVAKVQLVGDSVNMLVTLRLHQQFTVSIDKTPLRKAQHGRREALRRSKCF